MISPSSRADTRNDTVRVILADDHAIVRRGLAALLQMEGRYRVVAEANDGEEALRCAENVAADVLILDLSMPRLNGVEVTRRLKRRQPELKVLVLSMYDDKEFVAQTLQAGASGYILKQAMEDELFQALETAVDDGVFVSPALAPFFVERFLQGESATSADLTAREREILQLIAEGNTANEIAELLSISPHTANRHRANLMRKLDVHNQVELVRLAIERGLVILDQPPRPL